MHHDWNGPGWPTTVADIEEFTDEEAICDACEEPIEGWGVFDGSSYYYCRDCARELVEEWKVEAKAFAEEHCRLADELPDYDPSKAFRCTPEEYEMGDKESYSPNAHHASCRHGYSNYDTLISDLDRNDMCDEIYYDAIRDRITELIAEESGVEIDYYSY